MPADKRQLFGDEPEKEEDKAGDEEKEGAHRDALAAQQKGQPPDDAEAEEKEGQRQEDAHGVEQHHDVQNLHHRVDGGLGVDRAGTLLAGMDGDRLLQHQMPLTDKDQSDDVAEGHVVGAEWQITLHQLGAVDLHPRVEVVDRQRHQHPGDAADDALAELAVAVFFVRVAAAHHHVGVMTADGAEKGRDILQPVLTIGVNGDNISSFCGTEAAFDGAAVAAVEFVVQGQRQRVVR